MCKNTKVTIAGVSFKNPVMTASGTFGSGEEFEEFLDLNKLGGIVVKGVSSVAWKGNPTPRIAEVYGGMLNSIGLQNPGADFFIENTLPYLQDFDTNIIVNICGHTIQEYVDVAKKFKNTSVDMLELNVSCPNVDEGGISFGTDCDTLEKVVYEVKKATDKPLIVKLSPNVTDIKKIAKSAEVSGADAISLINTLLGMKIDIYSKKTILARKIGGFSGPAIKPVAIRMVYEVANTVNIPIIGMGGIVTYEDAIEFMLAGATAVAIGTANFMNPTATIDVINGIENYMQKTNVENISDIIGMVK